MSPNVFMKLTPSVTPVNAIVSHYANEQDMTANHLNSTPPFQHLLSERLRLSA